MGQKTIYSLFFSAAFIAAVFTSTIFTITATTAQAQSPRLLSIQIQDRKIIYSPEQKISADMRIWPDGPMGAVATSSGRMEWYGNGGAGTTINGPITKSVGLPDDPMDIVIYRRKEIQERKATDLGYMGGGPLYKDPVSGALLMFYHAEVHYGADPSKAQGRVGIAVSKDGGTTFTDTGLILTPEVNIETKQFTFPHNILVVGDYMHVYFRDMKESTGIVNLAVARAPLRDVVDHALLGETVSWKKYYNGAFTEPGIGGKASPLEQGNPLLRNMDFVEYPAQNLYIMIATTGNDAVAYSHFYSTSADGIHWSPRTTLYEPETPKTLLYITAVGNFANNPKKTNGTIHLLYTEAPNPIPGGQIWANTSLAYAKLNILEPDPTTGPTLTPELTPQPTTKPCETQQKADANCDGKTTLIDFEIWRITYTKTDDDTRADFNEDGSVSLADYQLWKRIFMPQPTNTPEPSATPEATMTPEPTPTDVP